MMNPSDEWVDAYIDSHPDSCIEDAERAWWDEQVEKGEDVGGLTPEAEAVSKAMRKGQAVDAYGKARKRERKPDEVKREVVATVAQNLPRCWLSDGEVKVTDITTPNPEREIRFRIGSDLYSLTLTKHRPPKG